MEGERREHQRDGWWRIEVARIIALHGGEIGVRPNPGGGSVSWFTVAGAETGTRKLALSG